MTAFFTSVLAGWLWRRALEVGGISTLVFQIYEALPNVAKVAITDLLTGHPERISLVAAAGVITSNLPFTVVTAGHGDATNTAVNASAAVICTGTSVTSASAISATGTITFSATYFV